MFKSALSPRSDRHSEVNRFLSLTQKKVVGIKFCGKVLLEALLKVLRCSEKVLSNLFLFGRSSLQPLKVQIRARPTKFIRYNRKPTSKSFEPLKHQSPISGYTEWLKPPIYSEF